MMHDQKNIKTGSNVASSLHIGSTLSFMCNYGVSGRLTNGKMKRCNPVILYASYIM